MTRHIFIVAGTRPEVIKLAPLVKTGRERSDIDITFCASSQHESLMDQVLETFGLKPDIRLPALRQGRSLDELAASVLTDLSTVLREKVPDCVVVQGDTATTAMGAWAGFYQRIPVAHVEAGMRSGDLLAPWPEEGHRRMISHIAHWHFAATKDCAAALGRESIAPERIFTVGNTGIDALKLMLADSGTLPDTVARALEGREDKRLILVTFHRRESFDGGLENVVAALKVLSERQDSHILVQVHPNPIVQQAVAPLTECKGISLVEPMPYRSFVRVLNKAHLILTDSGGIQEEAPSLGKPVLVMREKTERPEGVAAGAAKLVGTQTEVIVTQANRLLDDAAAYGEMAKVRDVYGDGRASQRILDVLVKDA